LRKNEPRVLIKLFL